MFEYELSLNGVVRRRTSNKFSPNIIALIVEDLPLVNPNVEEFNVKVRKLKNWKDRGVKVDNRPKQ